MRENHQLILYSSAAGQQKEKRINENEMIPDTHEYLVGFLMINIESIRNRIEADVRKYAAVEEMMDTIKDIHPYFSFNESAASSCLAAIVRNTAAESANTEENIKIHDHYEKILSSEEIYPEISIDEIADLQKKAHLFVRYILDDSDDIMKKYSQSTRIMLYRLAAGDKKSKDGISFTWKNILSVSNEMDAVKAAADVCGIDGKTISRNLSDAALSSKKIPDNVQKLADSIERYLAAEYEEIFYIPTFESLIWYELYSLLKSGTHFGRCHECGRLFPVTDENDAYCDIKDKDGTSCYSRHKEKDMIKERQMIYRKHYHRHLMRVKNGLEDQDVFRKWNEEAVTARKYANEKHLLPAEYEQIISKNEREK